MQLTLNMPKKDSMALWKDLKKLKSIKKGLTWKLKDHITLIKKQGNNFKLESKHGEVILSKSEFIDLVKKII